MGRQEVIGLFMQCKFVSKFQVKAQQGCGLFFSLFRAAGDFSRLKAETWEFEVYST